MAFTAETARCPSRHIPGRRPWDPPGHVRLVAPIVLPEAPLELRLLDSREPEPVEPPPPVEEPLPGEGGVWPGMDSVFGSAARPETPKRDGLAAITSSAVRPRSFPSRSAFVSVSRVSCPSSFPTLPSPSMSRSSVNITLSVSEGVDGAPGGLDTGCTPRTGTGAMATGTAWCASEEPRRRKRRTASRIWRPNR